MYKLQQKNHTALATDQDKATHLQSILEYSQEITSVLQAACSRCLQLPFLSYPA